MAGRSVATYQERLAVELSDIQDEFVAILRDSSIYYSDPNAQQSAVFFMAPAVYHWSPSTEENTGRRMRLMGRLRDWVIRYRLLFPHPTPDVKNRLEKPVVRLEAFLERKSGRSAPQSIEAAIERVADDIATLQKLSETLPSDPWPVRVVVDTNVLIDNPDVTVFSSAFPTGYLVHLLPVVLRELDELKRSGRTQELRENAHRASRRLKGIRNDAQSPFEIKVQGKIYVHFDHIEPKDDRLPSWLDLTVPDDRFLASALLLQSEHPGSAVFVVTGDVVLQTKLFAVQLPFVDPDM